METGDCLYAPMGEVVVVNDDDYCTQEEDNGDDEGECEYEEGDHGCWGYYGRRDGVRLFPPPIPMCHMPRILERTYEEGGRLVIREVKVQHHEFFRAHRENGRLTLTLVHMHRSDDDDQSKKLGGYEKQEEEEEGLEVEHGHPDHDDIGGDDDKDLIASTNLPPLPISLSSPTLPFLPLFDAEEDFDDKSWGEFEKNRCSNYKKKRKLESSVRKWAMECSILSSSMPELTESSSGGGIGHGCFRNGRSSSLIHLRSPLMHLVQI